MKNFDEINTGREYIGGDVLAKLEQATGKKQQQATATEEEQARRKSELKTQGRKGCKAERLNIAFTIKNYEFINNYSCINGETLTNFTNHFIDRYRGDYVLNFSYDIEKAKQITRTKRGRAANQTVRINMAFTPENLEFIRHYSLITEKSMTRFINDFITKYAERDIIIAKAKEELITPELNEKIAAYMVAAKQQYELYKELAYILNNPNAIIKEDASAEKK